MKNEMRTAALIHLDRLESNINILKDMIGSGPKFIAVLKGDAYGHGIEGVYPTFKKCGIEDFAVAYWEEGQALRNAGAKEETIMLLGDVPDSQLNEVLKYDLIPSIYRVEKAHKLNQLAKEAGRILPIQIKIDTGLARIGFHWGEAAAKAIDEISKMENLKIYGLFTHFARADEEEPEFTDLQMKRFEDTLDLVRGLIPDDVIIHTAGSPAVMLYPYTFLDGVRVGDLLYGLCPVEEELYEKTNFQDVLTWETYVSMIKDVPQGEPVGYGTSYTAERDMKVATIPVGYVDGFDRRLSNGGHVIIKGQTAPICGTVCMDQCMVDVTHIPQVEYGEKVVLIGHGMSILERSKEMNCTVDEVVCGIGKRVPRVYVD